MPTEDETNVQLNVVKQLVTQGKELDSQKAAPRVSYIVKLDTGDPAEGWSGLFVENRFDNELRAYLDGAFRTVLAW